MSKALNEISSGVVVYDYTDNYRCCGIRYKKWILTSGLILCSYIPLDDAEISSDCWDFSSDPQKEWGLRNFNFIKKLKNKVKNKTFKVLINNHCGSTVNDKMTLVSCSAYLVNIFRSDLVNQYVVDNFTDWHLCTKQEQFEDVPSDLIQNLLSVFVILQVDNIENSDCDKPLKYFLELSSGGKNVHRGDNIIVESSPFTMLRFYNSWSKGIVSNSVGNADCLFFTDTRLVIGCVGAPVYRYNQGQKNSLIGMILNPMMWSQGGWSGFSVAVNLHTILMETLHEKTPFLKKVKTKNFKNWKFIDKLDKSVVLVRCGYSWGSGVIVNTELGVIVTCAHVVNHGKEKVVSIVCGDYETKAEVIYSSKPGEVFDISVIRTEPLTKLKSLQFARNLPSKGETVYCVGFPMMGTKRVTLSKGVLANVIPGVLLQTTCCVECGASGGAIINSKGGLIGIPVSNISCGTTNTLYPHCNLVVPTSAFVNNLSQYFKTNDKSSLMSITTQNLNIIEAWSLQQKCKI